MKHCLAGDEHAHHERWYCHYVVYAKVITVLLALFAISHHIDITPSQR